MEYAFCQLFLHKCVTMRVAIIGAGVAGLCTTRFVSEAFPEADISLFEATDNVGGTWFYKESTKEDEFGIPLMTSMYKNLRTNLPKQIMEFSDFPIPKNYKTFMDDEEYLTYLNNYTRHFNLKKHIKFRHFVTSVKKKGSDWEVSYRDLREGKNHTELYDYVYVCNGHYTKMFIPEYRGRDIFKGGQLHSHMYRVPEHYKDKVILIVGAGPSGQDITMDVGKTAKKLFFSHHSPRFTTPFPSHIEQRPDVREFNETSVVFQDGTSEKIDEVLYCTGYAYHCPFLDPADSGIYVERSRIRYLYRQIVNIDNPTMFFIGVPQLVCTVPLMDMQARYTVALLKGDFTLPDHHEMMAEWRKEYDDRKHIGGKKYDTHMLGRREAGYYELLHKQSGVKKVPKVFCDIIHSNMETKKKNLYEFRNYDYKIIDDDNFVKTYVGNGTVIGNNIITKD